MRKTQRSITSERIPTLSSRCPLCRYKQASLILSILPVARTREMTEHLARRISCGHTKPENETKHSAPRWHHKYGICRSRSPAPRSRDSVTPTFYPQPFACIHLGRLAGNTPTFTAENFPLQQGEMAIRPPMINLDRRSFLSAPNLSHGNQTIAAAPGTQITRVLRWVSPLSCVLNVVPNKS